MIRLFYITARLLRLLATVNRFLLGLYLIYVKRAPFPIVALILKADESGCSFNRRSYG